MPKYTTTLTDCTCPDMTYRGGSHTVEINDIPTCVCKHIKEKWEEKRNGSSFQIKTYDQIRFENQTLRGQVYELQSKLAAYKQQLENSNQKSTELAKVDLPKNQQEFPLLSLVGQSRFTQAELQELYEGF